MFFVIPDLISPLVSFGHKYTSSLIVKSGLKIRGFSNTTHYCPNPAAAPLMYILYLIYLYTHITDTVGMMYVPLMSTSTSSDTDNSDTDNKTDK